MGREPQRRTVAISAVLWSVGGCGFSFDFQGKMREGEEWLEGEETYVQSATLAIIKVLSRLWESCEV